ncbi:MMPL family transporter [Nonomuraea sp. MCN248]|uniref:MMPL family transporter n=1 Tax=Nonomuraea corallina TaxID=2989783 RepID=A0ABT4SDK8_9ACTN|nr:MMPL family transporter [Nonomuraea corallina]MDA0635230.1 MMPL family transporter [Nonomuraea corallina]
MIRSFVRHRRLVVAAWPALVAALVVAAVAYPAPAAGDFPLPGSESERAAALFGPAPAEHPGTLVVSAPAGVESPASRQAVNELVTRMNAVPGVRAATSYERVSADGTVGALPVDYPDQAAALELVEIRDAFRAEAVTAELAGDDFADFTPGGLTEGVGLLAAAVILLYAFRSLLAAALPIAIGIVGVVSGTSLLTLLGHLVPAPDFGVYLTIMLGLGVGIDYALLIVTRFRTGLREGLGTEDAVVTAMRTAGRSVLFAGVIVIATGGGIVFLGPELGGGIAIAAGSGVLMVMLAALTLLPALLAMIGHRVDRFALPERTGKEPLSARWARVVRRRPWTAGLLAAALLAGLALPALDLRTGWSDASNRPVTDTTRRAHDLLAGAFGPGAGAPLVLVSDRPIAAAVRQAEATPGVAEVTPLGERAALVVPTTDQQDEATAALVRRLRAELPEPVLVAGATAAAVDFARHAADRLPWMAGAVLAFSLALLMAVFRSVAVPVKAVVVNLLSIGAGYGVVVAVFQWDVLGLGTGGPIDAWVPMMLFVITFGLSMDYEVFLMSRIREEYRDGRDSRAAVAAGLARTARVITAAAAIMFCVFAAFGAFDDRALRVMGVGLAAGVLVDATIVRLVLVPAAMEVLGERAWWFPGLSFTRLTPGRDVS